MEGGELAQDVKFQIWRGAAWLAAADMQHDWQGTVRAFRSLALGVKAGRRRRLGPFRAVFFWEQPMLIVTGPCEHSRPLINLFSILGA